MVVKRLGTPFSQGYVSVDLEENGMPAMLEAMAETMLGNGTPAFHAMVGSMAVESLGQKVTDLPYVDGTTALLYLEYGMPASDAII